METSGGGSIRRAVGDEVGGAVRCRRRRGGADRSSIGCEVKTPLCPSRFGEIQIGKKEEVTPAWIRRRRVTEERGVRKRGAAASLYFRLGISFWKVKFGDYQVW